MFSLKQVFKAWNLRTGKSFPLNRRFLYPQFPNKTLLGLSHTIIFLSLQMATFVIFNTEIISNFLHMNTISGTIKIPYRNILPVWLLHRTLSVTCVQLPDQTQASLLVLKYLQSFELFCYTIYYFLSYLLPSYIGF